MRARTGRGALGLELLGLSPHGGDIRLLARAAGVAPRDLLDFSASVNPLGPPSWLRDVILEHLGDLEHYPDPACSEVVGAVASRYGIARERIVVGNGSAEIIAALPRVLRATRAVIPVPTYSDYASAAFDTGWVVESLPLDEMDGFALDVNGLAAHLRGYEAVFIGRPNNPTGSLCPVGELVSLAGRHPRSWFVVDEAFVEFVEDADGCVDAGVLEVEAPNLVVLRSLTKLYAIPGLRLGFAVAPPGLASALRRALVPWSVNALAQAVGVAALADDDYVRASRAFVGGERRRLAERLAALPGLRVFAGAANYLLVKVETGPFDARGLAARLLRWGIAIRVCDDFEGLDGRFFRVAVRTGEQNDRLVEALRAVVESPEGVAEAR